MMQVMYGLVAASLVWANCAQAELQASQVAPSAVDKRASIDCDACAQWNAKAPPFAVAKRVYFVGTKGLSSLLIDTGAGLVIVDGGLPQSAARIEANVRRLGFQMSDVRYLLSSHEHFDHAGGLAQLQQRTGAPVLASTTAAPYLRVGGMSPNDPQVGFGDSARYPAIAKVVGYHDGQILKLGTVQFTAHHTPAHSPGSVSWQITQCTSKQACVTVLYADSLNPVSAPDFRFSDAKARVQAFQSALKKVRTFQCDVVISPHPDQSDLWARFERSDGGKDMSAFIDQRGCAGSLADAAAKRLQSRLIEERTN